MIEMYKVYMSYQKGQYSLENISLKIQNNEFVILTGDSGAGKSTLLKLITGQEKVSQGQIVVNGRNISRASHSGIPQLRRKMGIVFQDFKLLNNMSIMDNVALPLAIIGSSKNEIKHKAWNALKEVGLEDKRKKNPLQLSGGEQQRVAIARAIVNKPELLIADEPTGNLDSTNAGYIVGLLKKANSTGTTVVCATHDKDIIKSCNSRVITLKKGKIISFN